MPIRQHIYCDSCNKTFRSEHELSMHHKYTGGNRLPYLDRDFNSAKTNEEKLEAVLEFFDIKETKALQFLRFNTDLYNCAINRARTGTIHNEDSEEEYECSDWYKTNFELADFIENNIETMRAEYNRIIKLKKDEAIKKHNEELAMFDRMLK